MSAEQARLREVFSEAMAKATPEERERYLAEACGQDVELRRQVDSLLEAHTQAGDFLMQNVIASNGAPLGEGPGSIVGRYKLLQQIGEGGMGVVFMAEQQEPVRRMVALKIIKAGMDTKEVVARFEAGRQALALMDHPNIARVLDGGATDSGRPFFVMELIKGIPITEFCERQQLPIEARLQLFMKVCAGVQHAHQKGVIHRDLKPSNVLVTLHEGEPVPKVIDFGIAKAIGQKLTERTLFTRFEQLIGTPAYMSPEQAEWSGVDIDTRSDIYSLGVLLYELLTGTTPLDKETLARAALDEVRRMVRETDPPKPSTRLRQTSLAASPSQLAIRRSPLATDLDWIVMMALEKDPTRRYETVNGLARDVERHLKGDPVAARPPSKAYLAGKFIRKHRLGVAAIAGVGLALVAGLLLALVGFTQARHERQRAEQESATAKAINEFLTKDLLWQASPEINPDRDLKVREVFDRAATKIEGRFTNQPLVEASVRFTLAQTYSWLGERDKAEQQIRRAIEIRMQRLGPDHSDTLDSRAVLSSIYQSRGMFAEAESMWRQIADVSQRTLGPEHADTLDALFNLATVSRRPDHAGDLLQDVLEKQRRVRGVESWATLRTMIRLADIYRALGRVSDAAAMHAEAFDILRRVQGPEDFVTREARDALARDHLTLGDYAKAVDLFRECRETARRVYGPRHQKTESATSMLALSYGNLGRWGPCVELYREVTQPPKPQAGEPSTWHFAAVAALLAGDTNAYREFRGRLLAESVGETEFPRALEVAGVCLLMPDTLLNLEPAFKLAEVPPEGPPPISAIPRTRMVKGMAEYRRGNFSKALEWLDGWRDLPHRGSAKGETSPQAGYFAAMSHYRLGDKAAAEAELNEASDRLAPFLRRCRFGQFWCMIGPIVVARGEAERLVLGREVSPPFDAAWFESAGKRWEPFHRHYTHAEQLGGQGKWSEARDEYLAALHEPVFEWEAAEIGDPELAQRIGISYLMAGDLENFQQFCREWFNRLDKDPDPNDAYLAVRACLAGELDVTTDLGRLALKWSGKIELNESEAVSWVQAMICYRSGKYEDAIKHAKDAEKSPRLAMRSAAHVFRAMALGKSGRLAEGKKELAQAEAQLGKHLTNMTGDVWCDLGLCQLAIDEAHRLFGEARRK